MLCYIYARKSVDTGKGESIENQVAMCRKFIESTVQDNAEFVIYTDMGFSGKNTDRPQFRSMCMDIKACRPDSVVCYRLDRISRSVGDFAAFTEELSRLGISFISVSEKFDTSSPMGKAMMYITSVFAQLERETIAERVRDNMHMLAASGRWLGGTAPFGFAAEKTVDLSDGGEQKVYSVLVPVPHEAETVKRMYDRYFETMSISAVRKMLTAEKIYSRNGKIFSLSGIKDILRNPVYCTADRASLGYFRCVGSEVFFDESTADGISGLIAYNKREYASSVSLRHTPDKWIIAAGRHEGIITGKRWSEVQRMLEKNIPTGNTPSKMHNDYSVLSGRIFCEKCGGRMFSKLRRDKSSFSYICSSKLADGISSCSCPNLCGALTDESVTAKLLETMKKYKVSKKETVICSEQMTVYEKRKLADVLTKKISWDGITLKLYIR